MPKWCATSCTTVVVTSATTSSRVWPDPQDRQPVDGDPVRLDAGVTTGRAGSAGSPSYRPRRTGPPGGASSSTNTATLCNRGSHSGWDVSRASATRSSNSPTSMSNTESSGSSASGRFRSTSWQRGSVPRRIDMPASTRRHSGDAGYFWVVVEDYGDCVAGKGVQPAFDARGARAGSHRGPPGRGRRDPRVGHPRQPSVWSPKSCPEFLVDVVPVPVLRRPAVRGPASVGRDDLSLAGVGSGLLDGDIAPRSGQSGERVAGALTGDTPVGGRAAKSSRPPRSGKATGSSRRGNADRRTPASSSRCSTCRQVAQGGAPEPGPSAVMRFGEECAAMVDSLGRPRQDGNVSQR